MPKSIREDDLELVYRYFVEYWHTHKCPPTHREIGAACYMSRSTASRILERLEVRGRLERDSVRWRVLRIPDPDK
jgi:DNA-binding MarR family transcriptional regulator